VLFSYNTVTAICQSQNEEIISPGKNAPAFVNDIHNVSLVTKLQNQQAEHTDPTHSCTITPSQ